jgi:NTP pyrophosphatase (non-canonical NTP hydrolase)
MAVTNIRVKLMDPVMILMMDRQREFQARLLNGSVPSDLRGSERKAYIREQALALTDELHEALAETGWKSWATSDHINQEAYLGELADVYIFFMNLCLIADITPADLARTVLAKQEKNHKRQDDGYDGVSTKCPGCKRAYDDDAVKCHPASEIDGVGMRAWCQIKVIP